MFDTNKVASNIKNARTRKNMTQMALADEMGVSYQAVSNWERGNSMPDISKLPELCKILDIRFEDLVGEKNIDTEITERLMQDDNAEVTLEEMARVGQLVNPDKIEEKVNETLEKKGKIPFSVLVSLAPFMDKETLGKMAEEVADINFGKLCAIAPFLSKETLDHIVTKTIQNGTLKANNIVSIAPFLSKETIQKVVEHLVKKGQTGELVSLAPFMGKEMFHGQWSGVSFDFGDDADDGESDEVDLDEMDEDEVAELAFKALESGEATDIYLDYMDEDDVAELASKALEAGKSIECYLDYMDEDAVKSLLLQSTKR